MSRRCETVMVGGHPVRVQTDGRELSEADWALLAAMAKGLEAASPATPICDSPEVVFGELLEEIRAAIVNHPRSLQRRIGPSEIGEPCTRALIHKLAGDEEPDRGPAWKPTVGTAMHAWLESVFGASPLQHLPDGPRYLLEQEVTVGTIGGVEITGHCDLFDTASGTVVDWKSKGRSTMAGHRRNGPGPLYRAQAHLYGHGWKLKGYRVTTVMIVFLPRDGEFDDIFPWSEPYDEKVALDAIARANGLAQLIAALGKDAVLAMYPQACDDEWCRWCRGAGAVAARPNHRPLPRADNPFALPF